MPLQFRVRRTGFAAVLGACAIAAGTIAVTTTTVHATVGPTHSTNVAYIYDSTLRDDNGSPTGVGSSDQANNSNVPDTLFTNAVSTTCTATAHACSATIKSNAMTFTDEDVNSSTFATDLNTAGKFDTALIYQFCTFGSSSKAAARTAINTFVQNGGKVIIFDADGCASPDLGPSDYSGYAQPFKVNSVGADGAHNSISSFETDTLTTDVCLTTASCDGSDGDEIGDGNIFTSAAPAWCVAIEATNKNNATGIVEGYATQSSGGGLSVYIGTDTWFTFSRTPFNTTLFENAAAQGWNPSGLPCKQSVVGVISPTPTPTPTASVSAATVAVPATGAEDIRATGSMLALILVVAGAATLVPAALLRTWVTRRRRKRH